jgi:hypothetical protein
MTSEIAYYDTEGRLRSERARGPERVPLAVRYRALALRTANGSIAAFPPPHQYFFARDLTTNLGYVWSSAFGGAASIGIRQWPDDNTSYYPWMNAPPGTEQHMSVFFQLSDREPAAALAEVLRYTHSDRFRALDGFKVITSHWHFAYTVQALEKGFDWTPPFKPVLKDLGVDAAVIMDFHGDGHPRDLTDLRLKELEAYFRGCRAQSDAGFLLIPSEEANVYLGGHWALVFPKPVYWFMGRPAGAEFLRKEPHYGLIYRVANVSELLEMVRREGGYMYQTHPRTKGSTGFPDQIRDTEHFRDPHYLGAGWKAMPSDLSSPRLGERALRLLDDMNNWGRTKRLIGEVDVFQINSTHELYAHMNANYVRLGTLPDFDHYGKALEALAHGDGFITTGEVLLPHVAISGASDRLAVRVRVTYTFPLTAADIVWGDGEAVHLEAPSLDETASFGNREFNWTFPAKDWKWARLAVWDIAGNGALTNPMWR